MFYIVSAIDYQLEDEAIKLLRNDLRIFDAQSSFLMPLDLPFKRLCLMKLVKTSL